MDEDTPGFERTVKITGDTPFTIELRKFWHFDTVRQKAIDQLKLYAKDPQQGEQSLTGKSDFKLSVQLLGVNLPKLQYLLKPIYDYGVMMDDFDGNVAATYLGSFNLDYHLSNVDLAKRTATLTFHVTNKTGYQSGTYGILSDDCGGVQRQDVTWDEPVTF